MLKKHRTSPVVGRRMAIEEFRVSNMKLTGAQRRGHMRTIRYYQVLPPNVS
jgi:hypothetical protein